MQKNLFLKYWQEILSSVILYKFDFHWKNYSEKSKINHTAIMNISKLYFVQLFQVFFFIVYEVNILIYLQFIWIRQWL